MQHNLLLRGGTVVDGTGAPAREVDVRVRNGLIAEIGAGLEAAARERVIDARGCYVTPGFIETHNHFDAPMWWTPTLDPMPGYGVTTSINGNCGFSAAPVSDDPEVRLEMVKIFSFFEDIPIKPFMDALPWDWRTWSEYKHSLQTRLKFPANIAAYTGHIAIRLAVMGMEAWDRVARPDEIAKMCRLLDDALGAGALGLSSNLLDHDSRDRAVPSLVADDAEFGALLDVLAKYPGTTFQVIVDSFMRMTAEASVERMARLCAPRNIRMQWVGVPTYAFQEKLRGPLFAQHERFKARGLDFWTGFHHLPATSSVSFLSSLVFAQSNNYVWHEIISAPTEEAKLALLEDPAWRACPSLLGASLATIAVQPSARAHPLRLGIRLRTGRRLTGRVCDPTRCLAPIRRACSVAARQRHPLHHGSEALAQEPRHLPRVVPRSTGDWQHQRFRRPRPDAVRCGRPC